MRTHAFRIVGFTVLLAALDVSAQEERGPCTYGGSVAPCAPYGCLPSAGPDVDRDMVPTGDIGFCGKCKEDSDCSGAKCNQDGTCARYDAPPVPKPVWPRFNLMVADASVNLADANDPKPILAIGYLFQGALSKTRPILRDSGGYVTADLPRFYANGGFSAALAGPGQNIFVDAGVTYYRPGMPLSLTTMSFGFLYQRQGASVWNFGAEDENADRLGPAAMLGFLQNLYLRGAYVFPLRGTPDHGAVILSVVYMRDLTGDLVPDRFRKHLPKALQ